MLQKRRSIPCHLLTFSVRQSVGPNDGPVGIRSVVQPEEGQGFPVPGLRILIVYGNAGLGVLEHSLVRGIVFPQEASYKTYFMSRSKVEKNSVLWINYHKKI